NTRVMRDLFGNGIFATDGENWRHQRKLASHEFSTKVLRDFSSDVFRINAAKLAEKISYAAANRITINMQKAREDILSRFILASEEDPVTMNDRYLRDIVLSFLIAGKDTTANTLSWFIYMLCKNPIVQDKIAYEIKESVELAQEDNIETFTARLKQGAIDKMQYLHATLTETLRLYPAVPVDGKMADEDDLLPNGYRVIKGDGMNYMIYAM
uniref:Cytochrome P450 n=1 Tax=Aegilops tauschii subsp. strangulata TaxID=200361 RepID=A0A453QJA1_AEGTS